MTLNNDDILTFLANDLNIEDEIDADTELFSTGFLDSVAMMNLINFVEEKSRIEVHPQDVTLDNFDTVQRITDYVASNA